MPPQYQYIGGTTAQTGVSLMYKVAVKADGISKSHFNDVLVLYLLGSGEKVSISNLVDVKNYYLSLHSFF